MNIKIIFIKRENWSRIRDQRYFNSPFLSYWRVTNFEMSVMARREPAWQIIWQIPAKTHYQYSCHWSLLWISPPASQAPALSSSLILQPLEQLEWAGLLALWSYGLDSQKNIIHIRMLPMKQVADKWGFPLLVRFQWFPQAWGQNLVVQYCPWFHSWQGGTSSSNPPPLNHLQRSPHFLLWIYFFGGSTIRTVPTEMSFHPAPMIQKWLWIEYLKLTQFILNRMVKSKQSCNETFLIFKEQISGMSG